MHRGLDFVAVRAKQRPQIIQIVLAIVTISTRGMPVMTAPPEELLDR